MNASGVGSASRRPRLGFLGVGWIGRNRLQAIVEADVADVVAIADPSAACRDAARAIAPTATLCEHLGQLLEHPLDGIVIATPSALHADHALAALARGKAVFCQKPLGRSGDEARRVVDAARAADRLLGVDLSYRHTSAVKAVAPIVRTGGIGRVFAVDLAFHNAYGPEAAWFYDRAQSGGGCVIDLGVHLLDLALWILAFPEIEHVDSHLFQAGFTPLPDATEDFASVQMTLAGGVVLRLSCSWRVSAGRDCVIEARMFGTNGGVAITNVGGSFYDFVAERYRGTRAELLVEPPDAWGGRAAIAWVDQLSRSPRFHLGAEEYVAVAHALDRIYEAGARQER